MQYQPDFDALKELHTKESEEKKGRIDRRVYRIAVHAGGRLTVSEQDEIVEAAETLLGIKPGGKEAAMTLLGVNSQEDVGSAGQPSKWIRVYDSDGKEVSAVARDNLSKQQDWIKDGYLPVEEGGMVVRLQKPKPLDGPVPAADREVEVRNNKGHILRKVMLSEGREDAALEPKLAANGLVEYFEEKPRFVRRRS